MIFNLDILDSGGKKLFAVRCFTMERLEEELGSISRTLVYKRQAERDKWTYEDIFKALQTCGAEEVKDMDEVGMKALAKQMWASNFHPYWKYIK